MKQFLKLSYMACDTAATYLLSDYENAQQKLIAEFSDIMLEMETITREVETIDNARRNQVPTAYHAKELIDSARARFATVAKHSKVIIDLMKQNDPAVMKRIASHGCVSAMVNALEELSVDLGASIFGHAQRLIGDLRRMENWIGKLAAPDDLKQRVDVFCASREIDSSEAEKALIALNSVFQEIKSELEGNEIAFEALTEKLERACRLADPLEAVQGRGVLTEFGKRMPHLNDVYLITALREDLSSTHRTAKQLAQLSRVCDIAEEIKNTPIVQRQGMDKNAVNIALKDLANPDAYSGSAFKENDLRKIFLAFKRIAQFLKEDAFAEQGPIKDDMVGSVIEKEGGCVSISDTLVSIPEQSILVDPEESRRHDLMVLTDLVEYLGHPQDWSNQTRNEAFIDLATGLNLAGVDTMLQSAVLDQLRELADDRISAASLDKALPFLLSAYASGRISDNHHCKAIPLMASLSSRHALTIEGSGDAVCVLAKDLAAGSVDDSLQDWTLTQMKTHFTKKIPTEKRGEILGDMAVALAKRQIVPRCINDALALMKRIATVRLKDESTQRTNIHLHIAVAAEIVKREQLGGVANIRQRLSCEGRMTRETRSEGLSNAWNALKMNDTSSVGHGPLLELMEKLAADDIAFDVKKNVQTDLADFLAEHRFHPMYEERVQTLLDTLGS